MPYIQTPQGLVYVESDVFEQLKKEKHIGKRIGYVCKKCGGKTIRKIGILGESWYCSKCKFNWII